MLSESYNYHEREWNCPMPSKLSSLLIGAGCTLISAPAWSAAGHNELGGYHHMFGGYGPSGMFMGPVVMIVWIVVLVALVALVLKWLGVIEGKSGPTGSRALDILDERFARGEIDKKQFETMRNQLNT